MVQEEQGGKWAEETKRARHGRTGSREKKGGENESRDKDVARERRIGGANWLFKLDGRNRGAARPRLNPFFSRAHRADRTEQIKTGANAVPARRPLFRDSFISSDAHVIGETIRFSSSATLPRCGNGR